MINDKTIPIYRFDNSIPLNFRISNVCSYVYRKRIATLNETIDHKFQIHNAPNEASKIAFFFDFFGVSVPVVTGTKFVDLLVNCISKKIFLMKLIKYPNN